MNLFIIDYVVIKCAKIIGDQVLSFINKYIVSLIRLNSKLRDYVRADKHAQLYNLNK